MQHTILLIDDDEKLGTLLAAYFEKFNLTLLRETLPSKGLETFQKQTPDLVILDVMLPEMSGFEVCKKIREKSNTPIIMLTARGDVNDRVIGLELGADDYLPKPFEPRELIARIDSILARVEGIKDESRHILKFSGLTINKSSYEVWVHDRKIDLTNKEFELLLLLAESHGKIFARDEIMNALSGIETEIFSRSVDILISRLRNKLKPLDCIETVWGMGYKFHDH